MQVGSLVHSGHCFPDEVIATYPAIKNFAKKFSEFQNSQYRGEWNQNLPVNAGEVRDLLAEVSSILSQTVRR